MSIQSSGERALRSGYDDDSLAACCGVCCWLNFGKEAIRLAEAGKLYCWVCGGPAFICQTTAVRPCGVEAGIPARVHEGVAGAEERAAVERLRVEHGRPLKADGPTVLGKREYNRRYKARRRALEGK